MLHRDYEGQDCSIAGALEVVGERWTLLIIRDLFLGLRRFDELQGSLGIAHNALTADEEGSRPQHRADRPSTVGARPTRTKKEYAGVGGHAGAE